MAGFDWDMFNSIGNAVAPIIQMGTSLGTTSMAAAANSHMQERMFQQQKELNDISYERNKEMVNQQRQWNLEDYDKLMRDTSPSAAAQRYRDAGMSQAAALMASGDVSPTTQQTTLAPPEAGSVPQMPQTPWSHFNVDFLGILRAVQALRKEKVEADIAEDTKDSNTKGILDYNEAKWVTLQTMREDLAFKLKTNPYSANSIRYRSEADVYLPEQARINIQEARVNYATALENYGFLRKYHEQEFNKIQEEINKIVAETANVQQDSATKKSQENLNNANAALAYANVGVANATKENIITDTKGKKLENYGKVIENVFKEHGMPETSWQRVGALVDSGKLPINKVGSYLGHCQSYVLTAQDTFSSSPELRNAFLHDLVPGAGKGDLVPLRSQGIFNRFQRDINSTEKYDLNTFDSLFNPLFHRWKK